MNYSLVRSSKGQMKIQEMAFVLVAIMILMGMVAVAYLTLRVNGLKNENSLSRDEAAQETVVKLAGTPEFAFTAYDCFNCVDLDKLLFLKDRKSYKNFWDFDYLAVEKIYPAGEGECTSANYPNCKTITIVNETKSFGSVDSAFVSICHYEDQKGGYVKCEMARIMASPRTK